MAAKRTDRRGAIGRAVSVACFVVASMVCGFLIMECVRAAIPDGAPRAYRALLFAAFVVWMYVAFFVETVLHEAGHLVFGLLTGYSFCSFRIANLMWVKEGGRVRFARQSIAGTGGQCLMAPPSMVDGTIPVILYNMGGVLMNLLTAALFLGLSRLTAVSPIVSTLFALLAVVGVAIAATNGIPLTVGSVDNDARNTISLAGSPAAQRAFWVQLKANELNAQGVRLKDMPEEWFALPSDAEMTNSMTATMGMFVVSRLMDEHRFEEADACADHLLSIESGMVGFCRQLIVNDRLFIELIGENRPDVLAGMRTDEQEKFMAEMSGYPSVLRTEYAYALLQGCDGEEAEEVVRRFQKTAETHPFASDIEAERELMEIAEAAARRQEGDG